MLMDLEMPILTGLEATRRLCGQPGAPVVVMLTVRASDEAVVACLRAGAAGFLLKSADPDAIADALRRAAGLSNQQIADSLYMSLSTAKTNVSRILTKLGLDNRVQVALLVNGLLRPPAAETERK